MRINAHLPGIFVEHIEAVANFSSWLAPLATHVSGIFQTKFATEKNLEACHCLKLIRRELLPKELADVVEMPRCLKNVAADPRDVILLPKLYIGCSKLSQKPIVFIPWQHVAALAERPPSQVIPRAQFSARQSNEFLKTAEIMRKWGYEKAAVQNNMAGRADSWILPKIEWVFQRCGFQPPIPANLLEQLDLGFAFTAPLNIKVIKDNGKAPSADAASDCVLGAPPGHSAVEKGCPPGQVLNEKLQQLLPMLTLQQRHLEKEEAVAGEKGVAEETVLLLLRSLRL
eukprot:s571_g9.t1